MAEPLNSPGVDMSVKATRTSTGTADEAGSGSDSLTMDSSSDTVFVDYVPPPEVMVKPPAKYKLWLLIFVLVYFASWVAAEAKLQEFLRFYGWLSPDASTFLLLSLIVFVLSYGTLDLVMTIFTFQTKKGTVYGIGAWLKQPRAQWMYSHDIILFDVIARVCHILEDGFSMFDAPPAKVVKDAKQFECADGKVCHRVLKIEHRIKPDRVEDYQKWLVRIREAAAAANGLICVDATTVETQGDEEIGIPPLEDDSEGAHLYVTYIKFANIDYLNAYMLSPRRQALMKVLEPMLAVPDVIQIQGRRVLPDAFSDLVIRQGNAVPKSPPKKWKVWWLTTVALFLTRRWSNSFLLYYFEQWGLTEADERLKRLVSSLISTFLSSYVTTPLFLFIFDYWMHHVDVQAKNTRQPWKSFDEGFSSTWPKIIMTVAFYGGCTIAILVEKLGR